MYLDHSQQGVPSFKISVATVGELYRSASFLEPSEYREWALGRLRSEFPYDAALWSVGESGGGVSSCLAKHLPNELLGDYLSGETYEDDFLSVLCSNSNRSTISQLDIRDLPDSRLKTKLLQYKFTYYSYAVQCDPLTNLTNAVLLLGFSPANKCNPGSLPILLQYLHVLADAASFNFFLHLGKPALLEKRKSAAVCTSDGMIVECQHKFVSLTKQYWPEWTGPRLPFGPLAEVSNSTLVGKKKLGVDCSLLGQHHLVKLWERTPVDELSIKQLKIAGLVARGFTDKEISKETSLARSTISNALHDIYRTLSVSGRVELRRVIGGA